jgi:glycosyltransferase involved in cell wall biosynthesis
MIKERESELLNKFNKLNFYDNFDNFTPYKNVKINKIFGDLTTPVPTYTIFILTYKRPEMLEQALQSALNQNGFEDYEIVVVDNDPDENTETQAMMEKYKQHKNVFYYKTTEWSIGMWNLSLLQTRSEWVAFLHDDDLLNLNFLSTIASIRKRCPKAEAIAGRYDFFRYDFDQNALLPMWDTSKPKGIKIYLKAIKKILQGGKKYEIKKFTPEHYYLGVGSYPTLGIMYKRQNMINLGGWKHPYFQGSEDFVFNINYLFNYNLYYTNESLAQKREDKDCLSLYKEARFNMFLFAHFFYLNNETQARLKHINFNHWFIMATNFFMAHHYCKLAKEELRPFHLFPEEYFHIDFNKEFLPEYKKYLKKLNSKCKKIATYSRTKNHKIKWDFKF